MRNDGDLELVSASASFWSFPQFYMTYFPAERAPPLPHEPTAGMAPFQKDGVHWHVVQGHIWGKRTVEDTPAAVLHFPRRGYPASLSQRSCRRLTRAYRGRGSKPVSWVAAQALISAIGAMVGRAPSHAFLNRASPDLSFQAQKFMAWVSHNGGPILRDVSTRRAAVTYFFSPDAISRKSSLHS